MKKIIFSTLLFISLRTIFAQGNPQSSEGRMVINSNATGTMVMKSELNSPTTLSDSVLLLISNEVSQLLLDNHFDKGNIEKKALQVKNWIMQYVGKNPDGDKYAKEFTKYLRTEFNDKHFIFQQVGSKASGAVSVKGWYMESYNYGLAKLEWLPNKIGYIDYRGFNPAQFDDARGVIETATRFMKNANAIILDLRNNPGGDGEMTKFLLGMFISIDSVPAWDYEYRFNEQEFKSTEYIKKNTAFSLAEKKIYVLMGNKTGSAAELFCHVIQKQKLGILIGEKTSGGTHTMATFPVAGRFTFGLPNGRMLDYSSGVDLQQSWGIIPDVQVEEQTALDKAIELANKK